MRVVIDTNVLVSAIFFGGAPEKLMRMALRRRIVAVATKEILDEYQATIDRLLKKYGGDAPEFSATPLFGKMDVISSGGNVRVCRDPDDDKFLACAADGTCECIVSGDKDLLSLKTYGDIKIVTVAEFLRTVSGNATE